jgi:DNA topoisomerase-1
MMAFATALPKIRARVTQDLALPGLSRDKVLATVVRLLETTLIRVGNDEYARTNHSTGSRRCTIGTCRSRARRSRSPSKAKADKRHADRPLEPRWREDREASAQDLPGQGALRLSR